jgi:hypothetical protein
MFNMGVNKMDIPKDIKAQVIEKHQIVVPEKTIVIPAHVEQPTFRVSFDEEPLILGDVIELVILRNGKEEKRLKVPIEFNPDSGKEIRPLLNFDIVEMTAFSKIEEIKP